MVGQPARNRCCRIRGERVVGSWPEDRRVEQDSLAHGQPTYMRALRNICPKLSLDRSMTSSPRDLSRVLLSDAARAGNDQ
jgi:hypothetical protein